MRGKTLLGTLAIVFLATLPPQADAAADRYGGVWHPGKATGAFVPAAAGMTWPDVLSYRTSWGNANSFRITDIEVVPGGCPSERKDLFATNWEKATWSDKLYVVSSLADVQNAIANECRAGYRLKDFEFWDSVCDEPVKYVLLFRQDGKPCRYTPVLGSDVWSKFDALVAHYNGLGYTLVDFEVEPGSPSDPTITGVWYHGSSVQTFDVLPRYAFESEMTAQEGSRTLTDMESFRRPESAPSGTYWTRYVAGLWETLAALNTDDHELGEVYGKFRDLIYMQESTRRLADFEVYQGTTDGRFAWAFDKSLGSIGGGYAYAVLQEGELVAGAGQGYARQPSEGNVGMTIDVRGPVASVTKFFTALGVLRFAETQPSVNAWLDEPMIWHLPPDFVSFGPGVSTVTIRELLRQTTGLADFTPSPNANPAADPAGWRQEVIAWLSQPLADPTKAFNYQNVHFELLAIIMDEVELPAILNSAAPWHDWMNQKVFASAGVGPLVCGGTSADALSYPLSNSQAGVEWVASSWDCAGSGTGVGMFWASARDLAKIFWAFRDGQIVSPSTVAMALDQGLGLDPGWKTPAGVPMQPDSDGSSTTFGDQLYTKNGGLCGYNGNGDSVGSDTLIARFDDYNFDDDGASPPAPATNDYIYEVGDRDFDVGIMIHASAFSGVCSSKQNPQPRMFPVPKAILRQALLLREDW